MILKTSSKELYLMYLKKIVCENMGPISWCDIEPGFTSTGNPKPLILVGKNGTGKSTLLSSIVDSFFEIGDDAFSDLTNKVFNGHSYYKITGIEQARGGTYLNCLLEYSLSSTNACNIQFFYHVGDVFINKFQGILSQEILSKLNKYNQKIITKINKENIKKEYEDTINIYFPPERFYIPSWMGTSYSNSPDFGIKKPEQVFRNNLNKKIICYNPTIENTQWLMDLLIDAKATLGLPNENV